MGRVERQAEALQQLDSRFAGFSQFLALPYAAKVTAFNEA